MHTCLDQYNANKTNNGNGGLVWIQKGGGYYSECSAERLVRSAHSIEKKETSMIRAMTSVAILSLALLGSEALGKTSLFPAAMKPKRCLPKAGRCPKHALIKPMRR